MLQSGDSPRPASSAGAAATADDDDAAGNGATNRPPTSSFHQQKLPAWQPLLTAGTVFPVFLVLAVVFIALGVAILLQNKAIGELSLDYTGCARNGDPATPCSRLAESPEFYSNYSVCQCQLDFTLPKPLTGQVYAYYALTSFHQNHRKYVKSRDVLQLAGKRTSGLDAECFPYRQGQVGGDWVAPCGSVANSLFNDTFRLVRHLPAEFAKPGATEEPVPWTKRGISWAAEVARKYGSVSAWNGTVKPPNWPVPESVRSPGGYVDDEELQVWLSIAALPSFRKLHRRIVHTAESPYAAGLPAGNYTLLVNYSYPVAAFGGTKAFVLSTAGFLGGRNAGLGGISVAVGCLHLALCCLFVALHAHAKRSRESDPFFGMDAQHRILLEGMAAGVSPADNASDEEEGPVTG